MIHGVYGFYRDGALEFGYLRGSVHMGNRTENKGIQKGWDARQLDIRMLSLRLNEFMLVLYNINHIKNTSYIFTFHITRSILHITHLRLFPTTIHYRGTKSTRTRLLLLPSFIPTQSTTSVLKSHINTAHISYSPLAPILTTSSPEPSNHRHRFPSAFAPPPHPMFCFGSDRLSVATPPASLSKKQVSVQGQRSARGPDSSLYDGAGGHPEFTPLPSSELTL